MPKLPNLKHDTHTHAHTQKHTQKHTQRHTLTHTQQTHTQLKQFKIKNLKIQNINKSHKVTIKGQNKVKNYLLGAETLYRSKPLIAACRS